MTARPISEQDVTRIVQSPILQNNEALVASMKVFFYDSLNDIERSREILTFAKSRISNSTSLIDSTASLQSLSILVFLTLSPVIKLPRFRPLLQFIRYPTATFSPPKSALTLEGTPHSLFGDRKHCSTVSARLLLLTLRYVITRVGTPNNSLL